MTSPCLHKNSNLPQAFESPSEPQTDRNHNKNQIKEIVASLPTIQKEFNDKIEKEQAKITEELKNLWEDIKLQNNWKNEISEILKSFKRKIDMLKQKNRDLKKKLEDIQKSQMNCLNSEKNIYRE